MKVLLTGADGMLGSNISRLLLAKGYNIRAFIQPGRDVNTISKLEIEYFYGDLLNKDQVIEAAAGCDYIIHTAALTDVWPSRSEIINKVNIEGTRNIIQASYKSDIKRLVHVGTANSFGFGDKKNPGNESMAYNSGHFGLDYMDSKLKAQQLILNEVKTGGLKAIICNPTFMFGPYDSKPGSGTMIIALYKGKSPGFSGGGKNVIYVKDVASGICNALTKGRIGECYIMGHENLNYKELFKKISETINSKMPSIRISAPLIKAYGAIGSLYGKLSAKAPVISYPMAKIGCEGFYYSSAKAIKELNLPQTPVEIAIKEAFDWLKENKYI